MRQLRAGYIVRARVRGASAVLNLEVLDYQGGGVGEHCVRLVRLVRLRPVYHDAVDTELF